MKATLQRSPGRLAAWMSVAEILSMAGFSTYPALLPELQRDWQLTNAAAGFIAGALFAGYVVAVPVLGALTDRVDARRVYAGASALAAAGCLGFALLAQGLYTAALFQAVVGAGLAGTFMPGLRVLTDRLDDGATRNRFGGIYTAGFALGMSASLVLAGVLAPRIGWQGAFATAALGPALAAAMVWLGTAARREPGDGQAARRPHLFRAALRNPAALAYVVGYIAHCWEVFAVRAWMVAFLEFSGSLKPAAAQAPWSPAGFAAGITLLAWPAAILGNELAIRAGYPRTAIAVVAASAILAFGVGFLAPLPWPVVVGCLGLYFAATMADTSVLTAGVLAAAAPGERGATLGLYSALGFLAGFVGPVVFGLALDNAGGSASRMGWGLAFATLGIGMAAAPAMAWLLARAARAGSP